MKGFFWLISHFSAGLLLHQWPCCPTSESGVGDGLSILARESVDNGYSSYTTVGSSEIPRPTALDIFKTLANNGIHYQTSTGLQDF